MRKKQENIGPSRKADSHPIKSTSPKKPTGREQRIRLDPRTKRPQLITGKRWSARVERLFLETLAATANITRAAETAGVTREAAYQRRLHYPAFAEAWDQAKVIGYDRLEFVLIEGAHDSLMGVEWSPDRPIPKMTVAEALNVLRLHRASVKGGRDQNYSWRMKVPDPEEARKRILKRVEAIKRARKQDKGGGDSAVQ